MPNDAGVQLKVGSVLLLADRAEDAKARAGLADPEPPDEPGVLQLAKGRREEAESAFRQAVGH